jgi:hypothetical protein
VTCKSYIIEWSYKVLYIFLCSGALAEEGAQDDVGLAPEKAAFFPSLSFLGTQVRLFFALLYISDH